MPLIPNFDSCNIASGIKMERLLNCLWSRKSFTVLATRAKVEKNRSCACVLKGVPNKRRRCKIMSKVCVFIYAD
jgi:hypothetical protein